MSRISAPTHGSTTSEINIQYINPPPAKKFNIQYVISSPYLLFTQRDLKFMFLAILLCIWAVLLWILISNSHHFLSSGKREENQTRGTCWNGINCVERGWWMYAVCTVRDEGERHSVRRWQDYQQSLMYTSHLYVCVFSGLDTTG